MTKKTTIIVSSILSGFFCFIFAGCMRLQMSSAADTGYKKTINRVFVIADFSGASWKGRSSGSSILDDSKKFITAMESKFTSLRLAGKCAVITGLELDESEYASQAEAFSPDAVLAIDCISVIMDKAKVVGISFNISFIDVPSKKRFWRAELFLTTSGQWSSLNNVSGTFVAEKLFDAVMGQLKKDGMNVFGIIEDA